MAWIESHQELGRHPKTKRLARRLGVSVPQAIGHLHCLWWWALDFAEDGDLTRTEPEDIADAAMWDGDPAALVTALVEAGFCDTGEDGMLRLHDWDDYAGRLVERRKKERERARARRASAQRTPDGRATACGTVQYSTVPYSTNTTTTTTVDMYTRAPAGTPVESSSSDGLEVDEETPEAAWQRLTGQCINPLQSAEIQAFIEDGLQRDAVIWAMERTRLEGKGFNYFRGILKNLRDEGIYSLAQIQTRRRTRTAGIEPPSLRLRRLREEEAQHGDVAGRRTA